ncbi:MAG: LysM peptidoglycan-binding domain-containing protein [Lachnospiraceae bacterium]|nr:LysM peptidoglycan-binding domain-containing protein [Lachnospiraceae bacterium]
MRKLRDNPQLTVVLDFTYDNVACVITIPGKSVVVDDTIPWYGPLYLNAHYGQYSVPAPHANAVTTPADGTYSVANGDTLSAIASRLRTTVRHLVEVNHITDPDRISIGQRLTY